MSTTLENQDYRDIEDLPLGELAFISTDLATRLTDFNINTIGAVLGATKGLLNPMNIGCDREDEAKNFAIQLEEFLPDEIVLKYRESHELKHNTGLLIPEDDIGDLN